jgi:hypothetical protein
MYYHSYGHFWSGKNLIKLNKGYKQGDFVKVIVNFNIGMI